MSKSEDLKHVEMIIEYITGGVNGADYQYNDNHGILTRCKDCKFWQPQEEGIVEVPICARPQNKFDKMPFVMIAGSDDYCSKAVRKDDRQE